MSILAPAYQDIESVNVTLPDMSRLDNGIPLYALNAGTQDIIKITLLFRAGSLFQPFPAVAFSANAMLTEGTSRHSAALISEMTDFYGSYITCSTDKDSATVTLLTLRKYLDEMLPLLEEVVKRPTFPEAELRVFAGQHSRRLMVEQSKPGNIARSHFTKALFGNGHPYGYELQPDDFQNLTAGCLQTFHSEYYRPENCKIVVAGNVRESDINLINRYFGDKSRQSEAMSAAPEYSFSESADYKQKIDKADSVQSSIRMGKRVCNKTHEDYFGLTVVNTLLGGYFGSRLMWNLREDKAYTYGINSILISLQQAGYITIVTDVGKDVTDAALREIYTEVERLQQDTVPDGELRTVRTRLMSDMLRSFDGPFEQAESLIALLEYDLTPDYYNRYLHCIKSIDAKEIRRLAQQYLDIQRIYEIVVG